MASTTYKHSLALSPVWDEGESWLTLRAAVEQAGRRGIPIHEARLHDALLTHGEQLLRSDDAGRSLAIHELVLPYGRPDVVVAVLDLNALQNRIDSGWSPCVSTSAMQVLALVLSRRTRRTTIDALVSSVGDSARVSRAVRQLVTSGYLQVEGREVYVEQEWTPLVTELHGVEAKMRDWSQAAAQSRAWRFAMDGAWMAFPSAYMENVPRSMPAIQHLGLLSIDTDGEIKIMRRPRKRKPLLAERLLVEEYILRRIVEQA